ncbi:hypothetical protein CI610_00182 [invertebrate metagenome]|uniref:Uncharacterized protein n=1 Tax=invertebrate metagenome TaxID=1711999 RepID=A0A2H9TCD0_9ZZZZ
MLMVISPAKKLDYSSPVTVKQHSQPRMQDQALILIKELKKLSPDALSELMHISDKLAQLNTARFQAWSKPFTTDNARQALLAFKGDVYIGLAAETLNASGLSFAQEHVRILSGLYGVLRPLDLMQAYRLEMGTQFANDRGRDLYHFWGQKITELLNQDLATLNSCQLVNLASNEYFKSVKTPGLEAEVITPVFKDWKGGKYKIVSFYAKKARGLMVRYAIDHSISEPENLKTFDYGGYRFNPAMSSEHTWIFTRDAPDQ